MTLYKIIIEHRNYTKYTIMSANTNESIQLDDFTLTNHQLFNKDTFYYNKGVCTVVNSPIRSSDCIPGVLILQDNKTYGRYKKKLLYKCIPDDMSIPSFLIPYDIKQMPFSKSFSNLYVTFQLQDWTSKHPQGSLLQVIGDVNILDHFYEYQLYCKKLNVSIQSFHKQTMKQIQQELPNGLENETIVDQLTTNYPCLQDRCKIDVFSIDPANSVDFDDAFSIQKIGDNTILSIYISNVTIWLDYLQLWSHFSNRTSTIYLPDKKRSMLPTILSDCLCSLQANKKRIAFTMDITIHNNTILSLQFCNSVIIVKKNYVYEDPTLLISPAYKLLFETSQNLNTTYHYISSINDSHDVVAYFMILMNHSCAKDLFTFNTGIFRSATTNTNTCTTAPKEMSSFIPQWNNISGKYVNVETILDPTVLKHELLEVDVYVQITSPIRRLVDLLNMIQIQRNHQLIHLSEASEKFYHFWSLKIDTINDSTRSIRKVQTECDLLHMCSVNPDLLTKHFDGYCLDKTEKLDGLKQYTVYLPEMKLTSRIIISEDWNQYDKHVFRLYYFHHEEKFKKKIRLQCVDTNI